MERSCHVCGISQPSGSSVIGETEMQPSTRLNATQKISTKGRGDWELCVHILWMDKLKLTLVSYCFYTLADLSY